MRKYLILVAIVISIICTIQIPKSVDIKIKMKR